MIFAALAVVICAGSYFWIAKSRPDLIFPIDCEIRGDSIFSLDSAVSLPLTRLSHKQIIALAITRLEDSVRLRAEKIKVDRNPDVPLRQYVYFFRGNFYFTKESYPAKERRFYMKYAVRVDPNSGQVDISE